MPWFSVRVAVTTVAGLTAFGAAAVTPVESAAASPNSVTCIYNVRLSSEVRGSAEGRGEIDRTSKSSVSNVKLILWQRPASTKSGGW
jgi:hypothetical protein